MDANIPSPTARLRGEVVYFFAYDIAYELSRELPASLMGHQISEYRLDASKRNPKHLVFYRPRMIRLPPRIGSALTGPFRFASRPRSSPSVRSASAFGFLSKWMRWPI